MQEYFPCPKGQEYAEYFPISSEVNIGGCGKAMAQWPRMFLAMPPPPPPPGWCPLVLAHTNRNKTGKK
jgi:hypothetical protein